jgi:S1-C subfamily serine protease
MKSRYQKWLWPVVVLDVMLIIIVAVTGPAAFKKYQARAAVLIPAQTTAAAPTQVLTPLKVELVFPDVVVEQVDYPFTIKIKNQSEKDIRLEKLDLPASYTYNNEVITSEPAFGAQEPQETGISFPLGITLKPGEDRTFIFIMRAAKMQAVNDKIYIQTDQGKVNAPLMMAVAPEMKSQPYVNEAFPYQAVVKISAMYKDSTGTLQTGWTGVGSIISSDGLILTNAHTVLPNRSLPVDALKISMLYTRDTPPVDSYLAEVVQADYYLDLAVIRINADLKGKAVNRAGLKLPVVEFATPDKLVLGRKLSILGIGTGSRQLVTQISGDVSGFTAQTPFGDKAFVQTSANIPAAYSGGMALDEFGKLLAVPVLKVSPKGVLGEGDCRYLADTNNDRTTNSKDLCMPSVGVVGGLRPLELIQPMVDAAENGEVKITGYPHDQIPLPRGNQVSLKDNFMDLESGWVNSSSADRFGSYDNGVYQITLNGEGQIGISIYQNKKFTDSVASVKVSEVTSADDSFTGMICRYTNIENFYLFLVSTDGRYSIQKVENDQYAVLVPWTYSPVIPIHQDMKITTVCQDTTLTLAVNGIPVGQVKNSAHWRGLTGLAAGTFSSGHFAVAYDDIEVKAP